MKAKEERACYHVDAVKEHPGRGNGAENTVAPIQPFSEVELSNEALIAYRNVRLPVAQKFVLIALADIQNSKTLRCDPRVSVLCAYTCLSERSVRAALKALEASGFICRNRRTGHSTAYKLIYTPAPAAPPRDGIPAYPAPTPATDAPSEVHLSHPESEVESQRISRRDKSLWKQIPDQDRTAMYAAIGKKAT